MPGLLLALVTMNNGYVMTEAQHVGPGALGRRTYACPINRNEL